MIGDRRVAPVNDTDEVVVVVGEEVLGAEVVVTQDVLVGWRRWGLGQELLDRLPLCSIEFGRDSAVDVGGVVEPRTGVEVVARDDAVGALGRDLALSS